jgi:hypothetical protein
LSRTREHRRAGLRRRTHRGRRSYDDDGQRIGHAGTGELPGRLESVELGHPDVEQADVGAQPARQLHRHPPVDRLADDIDVGLRLEHHTQPGTDDRLVVSD